MALFINDLLALSDAFMAAFISMTSFNVMLALRDGFMAVLKECLVVKLTGLLVRTAAIFKGCLVVKLSGLRVCTAVNKWVPQIWQRQVFWSW